MIKRHINVLSLALAALCLSHAPSRADARLGVLDCAIEDRFAPAFRNVACVYDRGNGVIETYTGYTGFVDAGGDAHQLFDVFSTSPHDPSGLQGDYDPTSAGTLAGPATLYLIPRSNEPIPLGAALNALTSLEKLHLIYAGVTYPAKRHPARRH